MLRGVYVLIIRLDEDVGISIGALGEIFFRKGLYAYVGSAQSNLEKRVERHLRKEKRNFWHIDYLLQCEAAKVLKVFYQQAGKTEECLLAAEISKKGEAINHFGCSDCQCKSHLVYLRNYKFLQKPMHVLNLET